MNREQRSTFGFVPDVDLLIVRGNGGIWWKVYGQSPQNSSFVVPGEKSPSETFLFGSRENCL